MKGLKNSRVVRGWVPVGLLGSRRVPTPEGRAGPPLAMVGAMVREVVGSGGSWGALAGCMGAAAIAGNPSWAP